MAKLKSMDTGSVAIHVGASMAIIGVVLGLIYALGGAFMDMGMMGWNGGTTMALFAIIGIPLYLGFVGAIGGVIWASCYNLVARRFGGIEIELAE